MWVYIRQICKSYGNLKYFFKEIVCAKTLCPLVLFSRCLHYVRLFLARRLSFFIYFFIECHWRVWRVTLPNSIIGLIFLSDLYRLLQITTMLGTHSASEPSMRAIRNSRKKNSKFNFDGGIVHEITRDRKWCRKSVVMNSILVVFFKILKTRVTRQKKSFDHEIANITLFFL